MKNKLKLIRVKWWHVDFQCNCNIKFKTFAPDPRYGMLMFANIFKETLQPFWPLTIACELYVSKLIYRRL